MQAIKRAPEDWSSLASPDEWSLCGQVLATARGRGIPFALGGGLAFSVYAERLRHTKDFDLFILPKDREAMISITRELGLIDYYDTLPYQRHWLYRGTREGVIIDLMWQMANERAEVDERWLSGRSIQVHGFETPLLPPEELIWSKLYVLQRERTDWPDILNIMSLQGEIMDWARLLDRVEDDAPLLGGLMLVFSWMCPESAARLPNWIWERIGIAHPLPASLKAKGRRRIDLLDTRDWFGPSGGPPEQKT